MKLYKILELYLILQQRGLLHCHSFHSGRQKCKIVRHNWESIPQWTLLACESQKTINHLIKQSIDQSINQSINLSLAQSRVTVKGYWQNAPSAWKKPGVKTTQVETRKATCVWFILSYLLVSQARLWLQTTVWWQFADDYSSQTVCTVAEVASGKDHAQRFSSWVGREA